MDDERFSRFATDPKFRTVPKKQKKVTIDGRFKSMFQEKRFSSKTAIDKRGKPFKFDSKDNYRKYYNLEEEEEEKEEKGDENSDKKGKKDGKSNLKKKLKDLSVDYARGEGRLDSESSSSEEEEDQDDESEEDDDKEDEVTI